MFEKYRIGKLAKGMYVIRKRLLFFFYRYMTHTKVALYQGNEFSVCRGIEIMAFPSRRDAAYEIYKLGNGEKPIIRSFWLKGKLTHIERKI